MYVALELELVNSIARWVSTGSHHDCIQTLKGQTNLTGKGFLGS